MIKERDILQHACNSVLVSMITTLCGHDLLSTPPAALLCSVQE
jgi:hypothetical protein